MNFNLGDILDAASKRMDIANEADRAVNESRRDPEMDAHMSNQKMLSDLENQGLDVSALKNHL